MSNNKDFKVKNGIKPTGYHEAVGTVVSGSVGYYLAGASYDSVSFSVAGQDTNPFGCFFKPDGTKMYMVGDLNNTVYQYSLSTSWDVSTASYDSVSFSILGQEDLPSGIFFKPDGSKMYISGQRGDDLNQYSLSTAWDISTASFDSKTLLLNQSTNPYGCFFKPDGTKFYSVDAASNTVYQYSLSTAWDVSTGSYDSVSFSVSAQETAATLLYFNDTGSIMYVGGQITDSLYEYSLSTAWDVSTSTYSGTSFSLAPQETSPSGIFFKPDGTKMYMVGLGNDTIYQYSTAQTTATLDLSTGSVFELTPTSDIQVTLSNPAASGTVSGATLLLDQAGYGSYDIANAVYTGKSFNLSSYDNGQYSNIFFKPDGTKLYYLGDNGNDVEQFSLSTAWDISTATPDSKTVAVSGQTSAGSDLFFSDDGTKMYILDFANFARGYQYTLSTAWDVSTASYASISYNFSNGSGIPVGNGQSWTFGDSGTKIYIYDDDDHDIHQWNLSTAWNISTASYTGYVLDTTAAGQFKFFDFNSDGTKLFGITNASEFKYFTLSTPWVISTGTVSTDTYTVTEGAGVERGFSLGDSGTKAYYFDYNTDTVYQYSIVAAATITYDTNIQWAGGTAPTSPAIGDTDVLTFSTRDGGTTYNAALAIDGAQ